MFCSPSVRTFSLLLAIAGPLVVARPSVAQTVEPVTRPTDYAGWMAQGRQLLAAPGEGENETRRNYDKSFTKPRQAAEAFAVAATLARTDPDRITAWNNAALAYRMASRYQEAYDSFQKVLAIPGISNADHAKIAYEAALAFAQVNSGKPKEQQSPDAVVAKFNKVLAIPGTTPELQAKVHKEIGGVYVRAQQHLQAAASFEQSAKLDPRNGDDAMDQALASIGYLPPSPQTAEAYDRLYKVRLTVGKAADTQKPAEAASWQRHYKKQWAAVMAKHNATPRVVELWMELANDTSQSTTERFENLDELGKYQNEVKDFGGARSSYDKALKLPGLSFAQFRIATYGKAQSLTRARDFPGAIAAIQPLSTHKEAQPDDKALALADIGSLYQQQKKALNTGGATAEVVAKLDKQAVEKFEAGLAMPKVTAPTRLNVLLRRAQVEMSNEKWDEAHAQIKRGYELLKGEPYGLIKELHKADATVYQAQKNYPLAMAELNQSALKDGVAGSKYTPDEGTLQQAIAMYVEVLADKNYDVARKIHGTLKDWGLNPLESTLMLARIEVESGNYPAARPHLEKLATAPLQGEYKAMYEVLKSKMPAEPKPAG